MAKKKGMDGKVCEPRENNENIKEDEKFIDPYDYRYRIFLYGEDVQGLDEDETECND